MKDYSSLNDELDTILTMKDNFVNELINILFPIRRIINSNIELSGMLPTNIELIPIKRIIERLNFLSNLVTELRSISIEEKNSISNVIFLVINELNLLKSDQEYIDKRKLELEILISQRKQYVSSKYDELRKIDLEIRQLEEKISNNSLNHEAMVDFDNLVNNKKKIISDDFLAEDLRLIFDYDNFDMNRELNRVNENNVEINLNNINNTDDLYRLVNLTIKMQINEYMEYRYLSRNKVEELINKLRLSVKGYVNNYILSNNDLTVNIKEFYNVLRARLKGEVEEYFEIKSKLGIEYVDSKDGENKKIITIKEVVEGVYSGFENEIINKYATLLELSEVDEKNLGVVRKFVINMGPEFVPIFDKLWMQSGYGKSRAKILANKRKENITIE